MHKNIVRILLTSMLLTSMLGTTVFADTTSTQKTTVNYEPPTEEKDSKEETKDVGMIQTIVSTITDKLFNKEGETTPSSSSTSTAPATPSTPVSSNTTKTTSSTTSTSSSVKPSTVSQATIIQPTETVQSTALASKANPTAGDYIPIAIGGITKLADSGDLDSVTATALNDVTPPSSYKTSPITAVRKQSGNGPCWAFSEAGGLEQSAIIHQAASSDIVLDENYILQKMYSPVPDQFGLTAPDVTECDDINMGSNHIFTVWELATASVPTRKGSTTPAYTVVESQFYDIDDTTKIKQAIMANGYVEIGIHFDSSNTGQYKYGAGGSLDHSILLLGWDDSIPAANFATTGAGTPSKNGAWYFKDSGGFTETGFGWLSYADPAMSDKTYNRAFTSKVGSYPQYKNLYQYDGTNSYGVIQAHNVSNIFRMQSGASEEEVKAVGIGSATTGTFTMDVGVYDNASGTGTPSASTSQDINFDAWGYKIFPLTKSLKAANGKYVVVKLYHKGGSQLTICADVEKTFGTTGKQVRFKPKAADGQFLIDGKNYSSAGNTTPRIKLFTNDATPVIDSRTDLANATMTVASDVLIFDGTQKKPKVTVKIDSTTLAEGTDYTLIYENNTNAGSATVTATANSTSTKYKGSKTVIFNINQATLSNVTQSGKPTVSVGTTFENACKKAVLKLNDYTLVYGTDYVANTPSTVVGASTTTIAVKGLTNFSGNMNVEITVGSSPGPDPSKIDISTATVTSIDDQKYTGSPITLDTTQLIVKVGTDILIPDKDYKVSYLNNVNPGTATAIITGLDNYTGELSVQFKIVGTGPTPTPGPDPDPEDPDELIHASTHPYLSETYKVLSVGKSFTLKAPGAKYSTVWSMTDPLVAKVNTSGKVTALSPGICYIYAYSNNELYMPCKVVVQ